MSNPSAPPKKRLGCLGCGCLILVILALLLATLVGAGGYFTYKGVYSFTSVAPADIPSFDGGDAVYRTAEEKLAEFENCLGHHLPGSLHLNADEINTLIARDPSFRNFKVRLFVSMADDQGTVKLSYPTDLFPFGLMKGRYLNGESTISLKFDPDNRTVHPTIHALSVNDKPVPEANLALAQSEIDPLLNEELQKDDYCRKVLNRAKTIEIRGGELIIEIE